MVRALAAADDVHAENRAVVATRPGHVYAVPGDDPTTLPTASVAERFWPVLRGRGDAPGGSVELGALMA